MRRLIPLLVLLLSGSTVRAAAQSTLPFRPGMVVTASARIEPGTYRIPGPASLDSALIVIRGDDVALDLTGVRLEGLSPDVEPDAATGVAIRIDGGRNVTVRGGTIRGYRFGVLARGTRGLRLLENDVSYGWKPRLFSQVSHESLLDWLSFHDNESREWMRFGAAMYLEDVRGGEIRGNRSVQGMNALLMTRTDSMSVRNNDFSYNSGLGVGMYRSSHNALVRNRLDYDVRGYSHGFYNRGQDSAGLLLYEQSSHNLVAYNSATHSGDGLFLWAGRHTMDTGEGGANDNLFFYNDFSFAPTNGIEVTFSRNRLMGNILDGNRYGVWGGYSWETEIRGNCFSGNDFGIAIEHGQDNHIEGNRFDGDELAISLWANAVEPSDWGYPRRRDTRSRDTRIRGNVFSGHEETWRLENTSGLEIADNRTVFAAEEGCDPRVLLGTAFDSLASEVPEGPPEIAYGPRSRLPRSAIVVDEWGPYDGLSPKLWPVDPTRRGLVRLAVLGPEGSWRVTGHRGLSAVSAESGRTGDTLVVTTAEGSEGDWRVDLEYTGRVTVSPRGVTANAGVPVPFSFERFEPVGRWGTRIFTWPDSTGDPHLAPAAFQDMLLGTPALTMTLLTMDWMWYRPSVEGIPQERWAAVASAEVTVPEGTHSLRMISDDGARLWVDGVLAIDRWAPHGSEVAYASIAPGRHTLRLEYYQLTGWVEMRVDVIRGASRSPGSAGPH
ncbi:MAG TPA: NosD domain-containing protein [Longimicrobiales bacterium]|nr:NosD domain-containing protein [Longimicrobiales bacterium]